MGSSESRREDSQESMLEQGGNGGVCISIREWLVAELMISTEVT